jgi:hypothetical protein
MSASLSTVPIPVAALCKAWVYGRSLAVVVGSNHVGGHGCLSIVSVVCCQVAVSSSGRSLVRRSPTECSVSECNREASIMRRPWSTRGLLHHGNKCSRQYERYQGVQLCGCQIMNLIDVTSVSTPSSNKFSQSVFDQHVTYFFTYPVHFEYRVSNWSLLLPSPLTVCSSQCSYSKSDMQIGKRISWPFTRSCTVSSVF